jgi:L-ascorbate metabolism protein UlaG (beta-lactamase superfamily)
MRITKLGHSCVRLEKDGAVLVIDPGVWTDAAAVATCCLPPVSTCTSTATTTR